MRALTFSIVEEGWAKCVRSRKGTQMLFICYSFSYALILSGVATLPHIRSSLEELRYCGRKLVHQSCCEIVRYLCHFDVSGLVQASLVDTFTEDVIVADFVFRPGQCREVFDGEPCVAKQAVEHYCVKFLDVGAHEFLDFGVHVGVPDRTLLLLAAGR